MDLASCDVSDTCDKLGVGAIRTGVFRPLWAECPPVRGQLITIRLEPGGDDSPLPELLDVLTDAPNRLVLIDLGGRIDVQCWGTVLATAARQFGLRGALVNGAARDVEGLRELGFASYSRGVYPAAICGRLCVTRVGGEVGLEDGVIEPDAFAFADASGAVFLPADRAEEVLTAAEELRAEEEHKLRAVRRGADARSIFTPTDARMPRRVNCP